MYISLKQYFCYKITKINYHICLNLINESANFLYCPNRVFKTKLSFFFTNFVFLREYLDKKMYYAALYSYNIWLKGKNVFHQDN